jgi:hypothetical protein
MYLRNWCCAHAGTQQVLEVWLRGISVARWKWGTAMVLLALVGSFNGTARAQAVPVPPSPTIQETPTLENETLQRLNYNNLYEIYGGLAYSHFNPGPALVAGSNLGGFDIQGTRWMTKHLGATANARGYYGTNGVVPNDTNTHGPFIYEHQLMGGVTYRALKSEHAALSFHGLVGGAYGVFNSALNHGQTPGSLGLFSNGFALATAGGVSVDLNRSPKLALRLSSDYLVTRFGGVSQQEFAFSAGILYRFSKVRK